MMTTAAARNVAETSTDVDVDIRRFRTGVIDRAALLAECLDGADDDRTDGWRDYVDHVTAHTVRMFVVVEAADGPGLSFPVDTDVEVNAARAAMTTVGLTTTPIFAGHPGDPDAFRTPHALTAPPATVDDSDDIDDDERAEMYAGRAEADDDRNEFADPHGNSALRASSARNPRNLPCPTCHAPDRITPADRARGYQCDACADRAEGGGW